MDIKVILLLLSGVIALANAGGHTQHKYGFAIKGKYGSSQVEAGADDHHYGYSVNNHHKDGVSYIKQSGDNSHHGGFGSGGAGGAGGAGGVGGGFGFGGGF